MGWGYFWPQTCGRALEFNRLRRYFDSDLGQTQHIRQCHGLSAGRFALPSRRTRTAREALCRRNQLVTALGPAIRQRAMQPRSAELPPPGDSHAACCSATDARMALSMPGNYCSSSTHLNTEPVKSIWGGLGLSARARLSSTALQPLYSAFVHQVKILQAGERSPQEAKQ